MEVEIIKAIEQDNNIPGGSKKKLRVAAYCRVSTDDEEQVKSYNSMVQYYTEYIEKNPDWIMTEVYADKGISGTKAENRVEFQRLINDCLEGKIDLILAKSLSRFARNTLDTLKYVRMLKLRNIAVFFEAENINTLKDGEFLMTILSSVAQQEVENTSNNVKKGLKMKMKRGELVGFNRCFGYGYDKENKSLYVIEEEAEIVKEIFEKYVSGFGSTTLANEFNSRGIRTSKGYKWSSDTILNIIKNEKYVGDVLMGKTFTTDPITKRRLDNKGDVDQYYVRNHHEPIVERELFEAANFIRTKRGVSKAKIKTNASRMKYSRQYTFSSKLECGYCGSILTRRVWHSSSKYKTVIWECESRTKKGRHFCEYSKGVPETSIEKAFVDIYNAAFSESDAARRELLHSIEESLNGNSSKERLVRNSKIIRDIKEKRKKLLVGYTEGRVDEESYEQLDRELKDELEELNVVNEELIATVDDEMLFKEKMDLIRNFLRSEQTLTEFDSAIFEACVEKIIVGGYSEDGSPLPYKVTIVFKHRDDDFSLTDVKEKYVSRRRFKTSNATKATCKMLMNDIELFNNFHGDGVNILSRNRNVQVGEMYRNVCNGTCRDGGFTTKTKCLRLQSLQGLRGFSRLKEMLMEVVKK